MKIVHIAPFGPWQAGIYEAARDMVRADMLQGHSVSFVDAGAQMIDKDEREPCQVGAVDARANWTLVTEPPEVCLAADVIIMHTGCHDAWLVKCQAPLVWIIHGTPASCIRAELKGKWFPYSTYAAAAAWPRSRAMVYFWPEFREYWNLTIPAEKQVVFDYPPIDAALFQPDGAVYDLPPQTRGRYNGLICDSWREDSLTWEVMHGAVEAARRIPGLTWHITALPNPPGPFTALLAELARMGALGLVNGRLGQMDSVYRAVDFVLSARRSLSRVIGEALCCGTPVVAAAKCAAANYTADVEEPGQVAGAIQALVDRLDDDPAGLRAETLALAGRFDLNDYGRRMTALYERIRL